MVQINEEPCIDVRGSFIGGLVKRDKKLDGEFFKGVSSHPGTDMSEYLLVTAKPTPSAEIVSGRILPKPALS